MILLWHLNRVLIGASQSMNETDLGTGSSIILHPGVKALLNSLEALEAVLSPYLDASYKKEIDGIKEVLEESKYNLSETERGRTEAKLKLSALCQLMSRKGFLPGRTGSIEI